MPAWRGAQREAVRFSLNLQRSKGARMNRALRPPLLLCCASPSHDTEMPERFKTVELSGLSNADIVAIFAHDEELRDLVDTARTEKMNGATFAAILDTDNMTVRKMAQRHRSKRGTGAPLDVGDSCRCASRPLHRSGGVLFEG
ncbi:unnamed protein product [Vitrella brassicaformis CCMP3155]|uniref:Uncharacterized protein n=1 Tax=Vitrella brassicaformis (strain CCMP3155) TaxID=1169540 RepID=A0A0G4EH45_VITBC|nr:unnamed protein product [Vitrella brassicaformis CCMP3155]|eukprot:CEL95559.1 unnamed protein product [Vitrella brassicaformis CCMP3155]